MKNFYASCALLIAFLAVSVLPVMAQSDDLQNYISSLSSRNSSKSQVKAAASDGFTVIDLSQFSATERTTTLMVDKGQKVRFVNGTLSRGNGFTGPILKIDGGSVVEISSSNGTSATRADIYNKTVPASNDNGTVSVGQGTLTVKNYGWIDGATSSNKSGISVMITSNNSVFNLEKNGWVTGPVVNYQYASAKIEVSGGQGFSGGADWCEIQSYSNIITSGDVWLQMNLTNTSNVVKFTSKIDRHSQIMVKNATVGRKVAEGYNNYVLTEYDRAMFIVVDNNGTVLNTYLKDNAIYIGESDDLQAFINNTPTNARSYTVVDLSKFSATTRTKTLEINDGRMIRFVNGWLVRASFLNGPLVSLNGQSTVELSSSDRTKYTRAVFDSHGVLNGHELVRLNSGIMIVVDYGWISTSFNGTQCDAAVRMMGENDSFILDENGELNGPIINDNVWGDSNYIGIYGGIMYTGNSDFGTIRTYSDVNAVGTMPLHIDLLGKKNKIKLLSSLEQGIQVTAPAKTYNDKIVEGQHLTEEDHNKVVFVSDKDKLYNTYLQNNAIYLGIDDLQDFLDHLNSDDNDESNGSGTEDDPYKGYVPCSGIDVNHDVSFNGDDLQYYLLYGKMPSEGSSSDDCEGTVHQNDGDVYIDKGSTVTFKEIYWRGCGCKHYIYVSGTLIIDVDVHIYNYLRFIHILPGGRVIIRGLSGEVVDEVIYVEGGTVEYRGGDTSGGKYGWYCTGGVIYIYDGKIKGGTCGGYTGHNGTSYIYGGTVIGGIINYGTTYIHGGTITGGSGYTIYNYKGGRIYIYNGTCSGNGRIWNEGDLYIDGGGNVNIGDIYVIKGCRIYIMSRLTYILRLHITVDNIILNTPIIIGGNGYRLTQEDCSKLQIELPAGYGWRYDRTSGGIIIYSTTGIDDVNTDGSTVVSTYDITGRKTGEARKGINIERMSDGTVRKVVVK